jgi:hypothetical protein
VKSKVRMKTIERGGGEKKEGIKLFVSPKLILTGV